MRSISSSNTPISSLAPTESSATPQPSPWHSPVPYLFGGLAAMLGLIAFALLILACSYWKLTGRQLQNEEIADTDLESGPVDKEGGSAEKEPVKVYEEKILVIMAGDEKPTFLATPVCSNSSSFVNRIGKDFEQDDENNENCERSQKEMEHHVQATSPPENEGSQQQNQ